MKPLDLHDLINRPGYGNAQLAVQKAGHWDDPMDALYDALARLDDMADDIEDCADTVRKAIEQLTEGKTE